MLRGIIVPYNLKPESATSPKSRGIILSRAVAQNSCIAQGMTMSERQENPGVPRATLWFVMQKSLENLVGFFPSLVKCVISL